MTSSHHSMKNKCGLQQNLSTQESIFTAKNRNRNVIRLLFVLSMGERAMQKHLTHGEPFFFYVSPERQEIKASLTVYFKMTELCCNETKFNFLKKYFIWIKLNSGFLPIILAGYLCKPEDNIYNIDFIRFKIRDLETSTILFEIAKPPHTGRVNMPSPAVVVSCGSHEVEIYTVLCQQ